MLVVNLVAHGYMAAFLQPVFDSVAYSDCLWFLTPQPDTQQQPTDSPAVVALTLLNTQRLDAMQLQWVLFSCSQRWLAENKSVPADVSSAWFILARTTVGKLSSLLLDYRFLRS